MVGITTRITLDANLITNTVSKGDVAPQAKLLSNGQQIAISAGNPNIFEGAKLLPSIRMKSVLPLGTISLDQRAEFDRVDFGYIQIYELKSLKALYVGVRDRAGSVEIAPFPKLPLRFTDSDAAHMPWTRPEATRFVFSGGNVTCETHDQPSFRVGATLRNQNTFADNFLRSFAAEMEIACCLVIDNPQRVERKTPVFVSRWKFNFNFGFKWKDGGLIIQNGSSIDITDFKLAGPAPAEINNEPFLTNTGRNANDFIRKEIAAAVLGRGRTDLFSRPNTVPDDFFT